MQLPIYAVDRDNRDGRYVRRYQLHPFTGPLYNGTFEDTEAGHVANLTVPDGTTIGETEDGTELIVLPDGESWGVDDAVAMARDPRGYLRSGLSLAAV